MGDSEVGTVAGVTGRETAERRGRADRVIRRRAGALGGRAALGGLLISVAAVGVFAAYQGAAAGPTDTFAVAARPIRAGAVIGGDDVRLVTGELPAATRSVTFSTASVLVGRIALTALAAGEVIQSGSVTSDRGTVGSSEIALVLPRAQVAVGRLKQGERVDVFVTYDERTSSVVRGALVVQLDTDGDRSLTSERDITIVVEVPTGPIVAALVHALRTGDVTVVRSTFTSAAGGDPLEFDATEATTSPGHD